MLVVNSFDVWDTLIARRSIKDIHDEKDNLFPIRENISKVEPHDILVSDYYDPVLLQTAIPAITGLHNPLFVSENGKREGWMWRELQKTYQIQLHLGDNAVTDLAAPLREGIAAAHTNISAFSTAESLVSEMGYLQLAKLMREARLSTYDAEYRNFELLQIQVNFPILLLGSYLLHLQVVEHDIRTVLMSSRDCCLWVGLQEKVRALLGGKYWVQYFYSSRPARFTASPGYLHYINSFLDAPAAIVDLGGWGRSLPYLMDRTKQPGAPIYLLVKYPDRKRSGSRAIGLADGPIIRDMGSLIERANLAPYPMSIDVDEAGFLIYSNPAHIAWETMPEIQVSHRAFNCALELMTRYPVMEEIVGNPRTVETVERLFRLLREYGSTLRFRGDIMAAEEPFIEDELKRLGA